MLIACVFLVSVLLQTGCATSLFASIEAPFSGGKLARQDATRVESIDEPIVPPTPDATYVPIEKSRLDVKKERALVLTDKCAKMVNEVPKEGVLELLESWAKSDEASQRLFIKIYLNYEELEEETLDAPLCLGILVEHHKLWQLQLFSLSIAKMFSLTSHVPTKRRIVEAQANALYDDELHYLVTILDVLQKLDLKIGEDIFRRLYHLVWLFSQADGNEVINHYTSARRRGRPSIFPDFLTTADLPLISSVVFKPEVTDEIYWAIKNCQFYREPEPSVSCESPPLKGTQEEMLKEREPEVAMRSEYANA